MQYSRPCIDDTRTVTTVVHGRAPPRRPPSRKPTHVGAIALIAVGTVLATVGTYIIVKVVKHAR